MPSDGEERLGLGEGGARDASAPCTVEGERPNGPKRKPSGADAAARPRKLAGVDAVGAEKPSGGGKPGRSGGSAKPSGGGKAGGGKPRKASDLQIRLRTGAAYVILTVLGIVLGEIPTVIMLSVTAGISAGEFYYILRSDAKLPNEALGIIAAVLYPPALYWFRLGGVVVVTMVLIIALSVWYVFWMRSRIADVAISFFGAIYTGFLLCGLLVIRISVTEPWGGAILVLIILASVWANDGVAYLVGSRIGKHKLAPRVSPKKSWEGFIAGLITSMLIWCLASFVPGVNLPVPLAAFYGFVCGLVGVLGDLMESRIKRNSGVKDSGTIMPGHGGLLDRCDSLFLVSIAACLLLVWGGCITFVM